MPGRDDRLLGVGAAGLSVEEIVYDRAGPPVTPVDEKLQTDDPLAGYTDKVEQRFVANQESS